jgi:phospholipase A1
MNSCMKTLKLVSVLFCLNLVAAPSYACDSDGKTCWIHTGKGIAADRAINEEKIIPNYLSVTFHKPNYILPYYYTGSPDNTVYRNATPNNEQIKHPEFKYQLSIKIPVWKNMFHYRSSLYFAYTQDSFWQLYARKPFMRETDYEPEAFVATQFDKQIYKNFYFNFLNVGLDHQSNGFGNNLERSWNRFYVEAVASNDHWMVSLKPWYIISTDDNNSSIGKYMGYGKILVSYKLRQHVISAQAYSLLEHGARYASAELTYSFPISRYVKGYVQGFTGYGQSLIEFNHRTNSLGVGVALNDWV